MRTLLAVCAVAVVLFSFDVLAGGCQTCVQTSECGGGVCVQFIGSQGCGMNARLCCPGQGCALQADGGASCVDRGTCTIVGAAGGGASGGTSAAGGGTAGGGTSTAGGTSAAGGTAGGQQSAAGGTAGSSAFAGSSVDGGVGTKPMTQGCSSLGGLAGPLVVGALLLLRRRRG